MDPYCRTLLSRFAQCLFSIIHNLMSFNKGIAAASTIAASLAQPRGIIHDIRHWR